MKKQLRAFLAAGIFAASSLTAQTIQNGNFESWNGASFENPQYYWGTSNNDVMRVGLPFNVTKVTDPQQGTFAMKMQTVANSADTMFGYIVNGDPNSFAGGIPYNQHPITLTGYYKCNIPAGDTGIFLVVFKQGGNPVSIDAAQFYGNHSSYTPFTVTLSIPPLATPDSLLIAAASSNAFVFQGIPGSWLQLDNLSFTGVSSQPAQLNGSFENWDSHTMYTPAQWAAGGDTVFRTTDAHSGSYALQLKTIQYDSVNAGPSVATNGQLPPNSGPVGGRPYSLLNDTLCGWYKFTANGNDSATAWVITKNMGNLVGGNGVGLPPAATYTFFQVPFTSISQPDSLLLVFASSYNNTTVSNAGSILKVDDVYLKSSPLGVQEVNWNAFGLVQMTPNPAANGESWITFDNRSNDPIVIGVTDATGRVVAENSVEGSGPHRERIDTSSLSKGVYMVTLTQNGKRAVRKLVVE